MLDQLIATLRADPRFVRNVTTWKTLPPKAAELRAWPAHLDTRLQSAGRSLHIAQLYAHQARAVAHVLEGHNVVMATSTASGKTLGYTLPFLNTLMHDSAATALLLFPTKALAHDQIAALAQWIAALQAPLALRPYDGDTPQRHRASIRKEARILVSNPDMLHLGILPHHTQWMRFFSGLRYVILDELHTYRGVFGSHLANVLRRLRRIAHFYGTAPQLVAASATIANPQALAESLWEGPVTVVDEDGAPYGTRHMLFYNPPLLNPTLGLRASAAAEGVSLAMKLLEADVQTIVFARARITVELVLRNLRERAAQAGFDPQVIQGYRGGYLPHERRAIEQGLREGQVRMVVATNALELGIDIGALDAAILIGYPGSIAATRQQMGRAGRRADTSLAVLIATPAPLDQYLVAHPEYFFGRSPEEARVAPDTLSLLASHLACAAFELPFAQGEAFGNFREVEALLSVLAEEGILHHSHQTFTWVGDTYPAQGVSLRSASPDNIVVHMEHEGVLGIVDRPSAPALVHEGAIYFHAAAPYLIERLDWEQGLAWARPIDLEYYTIASSSTKVERLSVRRSQALRLSISRLATESPHSLGTPSHERLQGGTLTDEEVFVRTKSVAYRRVHVATHETLSWGEIDLPEQVLETEAFRLTLSAPLVEALAEEGVHIAPLDYGPDWGKIREQILLRDNHQCRICGARTQPERPLEVHHLTPLRRFLSQHTRPVALRLAHTPDNLLTLCPVCHRKVEKARGARTALSGMAYLLKNLAPVFLMCDPRDLGTSVEARDAATGQPAVVVYDAVPGGVGLSPCLLELWHKLSTAAFERVQQCSCTSGCPSCVGPVGESEVGAKQAARKLLSLLVSI